MREVDFASLVFVDLNVPAPPLSSSRVGVFSTVNYCWLLVI
jgi:hypothetical protein